MNDIEIPVDKLPSKGTTYPFHNITLPRIRFGTLLDYQSDISFCNNNLSKFLVQLKYLLRDLPAYDELLMYDAIPIMLVRAYASAAPELSNFIRIRFICPIHNKEEEFEVNLESIDFNDMDPELLKIEAFKLNGSLFAFRMPKVKDFLRVADMFKTSVSYKDSAATKMIWILSMFKDIDDREKRLEILNAVRGATSEGDGIKTLMYLYSKLTDAFTHLKTTCKQGGEKVTVEIPVIEPITSYFLNFSFTGRPAGNIFTYKQGI